MSSEGYLEGETTRHQIYLELLALGNAKKAAKFIYTAIKAAQERIAEGLSAYGTRRYEQQIRALQNDLAAVYGSMKGQIQLDLRELSVVESKFSIELMGQVVRPVVQLNTPSPQMIKAAALSEPMKLEARTGVQKISISGALDQFGTKKSAEIIGEIQIGAALGETTPQISRRLAGLHQLQRDQATALVRTVTNHVAATARMETLNANDDILEGKKRIATLDGRTSPVCRSLDGTVVPLSAPSPPFHWNCRTSEIPWLKAEYRREIPGSTRPSVGPDGAKPVRSNTTYQEWLERQPASFQREVLGPSRYALFSKGELTLDRFVAANGKTLTLDQLRELEPLAFKRAGL
ncbi:phage head morphogenesis protein [Pseudomonas sp. R1-18]|uniref:phage minor head protein n=1 Tax=Pseudomonas sp. R1-18 TaxID=1632772 RepID=UPI003DA8C46A